MSKKKTSNTKINNDSIVDNFDIQIFGEGDNSSASSDEPVTVSGSNSDEPVTVSGSNSNEPVTVSGGGSDPLNMPSTGPVILYNNDGSESSMDTKSFLEKLIPGKTQTQVIQETPMTFETFEIAKFRPTLANQIKRANNAANTTFNYLPY